MEKKIAMLSIDVEEDVRGDDRKTYRGVERLDLFLDLLNRRHIRATMFVTGEALVRYPQKIQAWSKDHEIGCHNYCHRPLSSLSQNERQQQIDEFCKVYQIVLGGRPAGFRAVQNVIDTEQLELLQAFRFKYDSSVIAHYPFFRTHVGYGGKAPHRPYQPDQNDIRHEGNMTILEIPLVPLALGFQLNGTWIRNIPSFVYENLLAARKPDFLGLSVHSWDFWRHRGKYSRNSGRAFLPILDRLLQKLTRYYGFKTGWEIWDDKLRKASLIPLPQRIPSPGAKSCGRKGVG